MKEITIKVEGYEPLNCPFHTSASKILNDIDPLLIKNAVAAKVNGHMWDLNRGLESDSELSAVTSDSEEGHALLLHSTAHLMAQAVKEFFPNAQMTIGPAIQNRFYYDFDIEKPFSDEDLIKIENRMVELSSEDFAVQDHGYVSMLLYVYFDVLVVFFIYMAMFLWLRFYASTLD